MPRQQPVYTRIYKEHFILQPVVICILQCDIRHKSSAAHEAIAELVAGLCIHGQASAEGRVTVAAPVQYIRAVTAVSRVHRCLVPDIPFAESIMCDTPVQIQSLALVTCRSIIENIGIEMGHVFIKGITEAPARHIASG